MLEILRNISNISITLHIKIRKYRNKVISIQIFKV